MILDRIRLNYAGINTDLLLATAKPADPFILKSVDGLGPPAVDVYIAQTLAMGGVYKGRRPQNREITFLIGLNPNHTINQTALDLRKVLYSMLSPNIGDYVYIQLMDTPTTVQSQIYGYVKTFEINQFSGDPEVQITISCINPYFAGTSKVTTLPTGKSAFTINNTGDAPTGFHAELTFTANRTGFTMTLLQPWTAINTFKLVSSYAFKTGDKLQYDSIPGQRYLHVIRATDSADLNIINTMSDDSEWIMLPDGDSNFTCDTSSFNWNIFEYTPQFWGI